MLFDSLTAAWQQIVSEMQFIRPIDSRVGEMREIIGHQFQIKDPTDLFLRNERRNLDPHYAAAETAWYLQETRDTKMIKNFAPSYGRFEDIPNEANGAYGFRIANEGNNQLVRACLKLLESKNSRQVVITLYNSKDLGSVSKDVPCTCNLKFYLRSDGLHMIADMRSNDVWLGLPYDAFAFMHIGLMVADACFVKFRSYTHQAGSMHLYEKDYKKAVEALNWTSKRAPNENLNIESLYQVPIRKSIDVCKLLLPNAWKLSSKPFDIHTRSGQMVLLAQSKFKSDLSKFLNPYYKEIYDDYTRRKRSSR